ncbi:hypothetical protein Q0N40_10425 [Corynebacterium pseudokroppenstedtii]|nr:hypothetical protein [Corynebacterium pseudokroppenstedtii]MDU6478375.1 hypothetical protein [Corynebacterium kroppenstedtii]MBY0790471.1 hypothetical protein [Corynebacterium pseudokroppenstedtii]MCF6792988.1 hypothetical protein [Corynebacterium pseudokroppenstedtii]MCG2635640.1 hypothetical protein [Corynebacterium pseudokroppenstedtii]MDU7504298.1 hypothetical protein [Corynebacterium kroppenstedtii]
MSGKGIMGEDCLMLLFRSASKENVCSYVIPTVGTVHELFWADVLSIAAVHLVIAELAAVGETFFWTWVASPAIEALTRD